MKPLYIISRYSTREIRQRRASAEEIRDIIEGTSDEILARAAIDDDGDIQATPLTPDEIKGLAADLEQRERVQLVAILDHALGLVKLGAGLRGVSISDPIHIWPTDIQYAEDVIRDWAKERGLTVYDEPMPTDPKIKHWIRTMQVCLGESRYNGCVVRLQWPSVAIGEDVIAVEAMCHAVASLGAA